MSDIIWEQDAQAKFQQMAARIPVFLRGVAQEQVAKKAADLAREDNRTAVTEKDMVDAFFLATPFGFHGPMKTDMKDLGIDYTRYGHPA